MIVDVLKRYLLIVWNFFFGQVSSESIQDSPAKRDEPAAGTTDSSFASAGDEALDDGEEDEIDDDDVDDDVEVVYDDGEGVEDEDVDEEPVPQKKPEVKPAGKPVDVVETPREKTPSSPKADGRPEEREKPKAAQEGGGDKPAVTPPKTEDAPKPKPPVDSGTAAAAVVAPERKEDAPKPKPEAPEPPKRPATEEPKPQAAAADDVKTPEKAKAHVKFEDEKKEEREDPNARFVQSEKGDATKPKNQATTATTVDAFLAGEQKDDQRPPQQQPAAPAHPLERPESIQDQTLEYTDSGEELSDDDIEIDYEDDEDDEDVEEVKPLPPVARTVYKKND